jgi:hypothetical protein
MYSENYPRKLCHQFKLSLFKGILSRVPPDVAALPHIPDLLQILDEAFWVEFCHGGAIWMECVEHDEGSGREDGLSLEHQPEMSIGY